MRSLNTLALLVGVTAVAGCSDGGSVNGVFPSSGFLGRTVRVEVSGDNVNWKDGVALDFGPGVTVGTVAVASPTSVFADITISDEAQPGLRDVIVTNGGDADTLTAAFKLESPLLMDVQGKLAQGSVALFTARNLDQRSPFDTTCAVSFFGSCLEYSNMQVTTPAGVTAFVNFVDAYTVSGALYMDIDAESGPINLVSGPPDTEADQVTSPVGGTTEIAARTATGLSSSPTTAMVTEAFDSQLYSYDATGTSLARFQVTTNEQNASPLVFILPETGHFSDMIDASDAPKVMSTNSDKFYAVYVDSAGTYPYSYGLKVAPLPMAAMAEAASNDTAGAAQVASMQGVYLGPATLSSGTDEDWIRIPVTSGDSTKSVHVMTQSNDPMTDTVVEVFKSNGTTNTSLGASDDMSYLDSLDSDPIGASATYLLVKISASSVFVQQHNSYYAVIWVE